MIRLISTLTLATAVLTLATPAFAEGTPHVLALSAQNGSGEQGTITLVPAGKRTKVTLALVGATHGVAQPAHIHSGTCATLDPKPSYALAPVLDGVSTTVVPVSMKALMASPFAVNVHESASNIATYVSCGDLAAPQAMNK